jgi:Arc/MetJ family transcription regulator
MRTNIDIDDELLAEAMETTGQTSKKATVEEALRRTVASHRRRVAIIDMIGMEWVGDLDDLRRSDRT